MPHRHRTLTLCAALLPALAACSHSAEQASLADATSSQAASLTSAAPATAGSAAPATSVGAAGGAASAGVAPRGNSMKAPGSVGTFSMGGPAPIVGATYDSMPYVLPLNPAGPQQTMVRWVEGWGQSPATAEQGTTYVLGHAWGQQPLVFNPISETVTANVDFSKPVTVQGDEGVTVQHYVTSVLNGSLIHMDSTSGGLAGGREWVVDTAYLVDKNTAAYDTRLINTSIPGRIVLIACSVDGNNDLGYNVIVEGHLT